MKQPIVAGPYQSINIQRVFAFFLLVASFFSGCNSNSTNILFTTQFFDRPSVLSLVPEDGATDVNTDVQLQLTFDMQMSADSFKNSVFLFTGQSQVETIVSFADDDHSMLISPVFPLAAFTIHRVLTLNTVESIFGKTLANPVEFHFTTGSHGNTPSIFLISPPDGASGTPPSGTIIFSSTSQLEPDSLKGNVELVSSSLEVFMINQ